MEHRCLVLLVLRAAPMLNAKEGFFANPKAIEHAPVEKSANWRPSSWRSAQTPRICTAFPAWSWPSCTSTSPPWTTAVYIVGLNIHTGFLVVRDGEVRVVHASYTEPDPSGG